MESNQEDPTVIIAPLDIKSTTFTNKTGSNNSDSEESDNL